MTGWLIFSAILLLLALLMRITIWVTVRYERERLDVVVGAGVLYFRIFPGKRKQQKAKPKKTAKKSKESEKPKPDIMTQMKEYLPLFEELFPLLLETAGRFRKRLWMERLHLHIWIPCGADPAVGAIRYGQANAVCGAIWGPLNAAVDINDGKIKIDADFERERYDASADVLLSIQIGQLLWLGFSAGRRMLGRFLKFSRSRRAQQRKAV